MRFVNVLGSAGSASELFLRQARGGVPLTITDTGMLRYWITMAHATTAAAHAALLAAEGCVLATPANAPELTVAELATRIWSRAGNPGEPKVDLLGIRRGETLNEVQIAAGEQLGTERWQGIVPNRAAKMGSIAVDKGIAKLGTTSEFYQQLDPEAIAEHVIRVAQADIHDVVERIMEREHAQLWHDLPPRVRAAVHARVREQLPDLVEEIITGEIAENIDQVLDPKIMVIRHLEAHPELANRVFEDVGKRVLGAMGETMRRR